MKKIFFEFRDYKALLRSHIKDLPQSRGFRSALAEAIGCQRAFVSQVLQGDAHFNLEHGEKACRFLRFSKNETVFFLLLVQYARAGTENLRQHFSEQLELLAERQLVIKNRIQSEGELSAEVRGRYYSSWIYGAIRVGVTIPALRTREALKEKLGLTEEQLKSALEFLVAHGLITRKGSAFFPTTLHLHLGDESDLIVRHHTNWRLRTLAAIANPQRQDLHYSAVVSLSRRDVQKLKSLMVEFLEESQRTIRESPEETLYVLGADFFEL